MSKIKIQVLDNAPYSVQGEIELVDGVGNRIPTTEESHLCRCGLSKNQPFCDGSHKDHLNSVVRAK